VDLRDDREVGSPSTLDTKYPDRERPPASWSRKMPPKPAPRLFQYISNKSRKPPPPPAARSAAPGSHDGTASDADVGEVYRIVTSAATPSAMESALAASAVPLSSPLLDAVMRRFRFAHGDPLRALSLLSLAADRGGIAPSPYAIDTALYVLGRARRFPHMWNLVANTRRICPDALTPRTAMIVLGRVAKVCSVRETVASFRCLARLFHTVDPAVLFNALLRTLCQEKSMSDARNVFHALKYEFRVNRHTFNILLSGWKSAEDAEAFVTEMRELGVEPDLVTYNSLIDCHCKNRDVQKAYKLLDEMRHKDISPDIITYTSLIGGLGLIGQPDKAKDLLKEMYELGCYPDVPAYNAAIRNFVIAKRLGDAFALMDQMVSKGLMPNPTTYNLFFRCYYWAFDIGSAWRLYERMRSEGCYPNTQSCMFIIRLCHRYGKVALALELWSDMVSSSFGSLTLVSDVLLDLLCDEGKLEDAERCFCQMVELGQKPSNVAFRRIKILMQLAKQEESIARLTEKMIQFGRLPPVDCQRVQHSVESRPSNGDAADADILRAA
jgi:pentatricopeptide repeat protein